MVREIELAKEKISGGDYLGARKLLLEVKRKFPEVDNISGMIAVCDILFSSSALRFMDVDFYFVLQIHPEATCFEIKFKYKKFTALLEPLSNNCPGTESALRIVHEAVSVLCHQEKRKMFDVQRTRKLESYVSKSPINQDCVTDAEVFDVQRTRKLESYVSKSPINQDSVTDAEDSLSWRMGSSNYVGERQVLTTLSRHAIPVPELSDHAEAKPLKHKWSVKDFCPRQIWAIYHGQDLMPQRYVVVNNVVSWNKVNATLLEPHPMLDEEKSWVRDNLPFGSGLFSCGETSLDLDLSRFSHAVKSEKTMVKEESLYKIYPEKGEVWAMIKNNNQYQIVEIVSEFSEEYGLVAVSLKEVPGWKSFFQKQLQNGYEMSQTVTRGEMVRFCHQVPAYTVEGVEFHGIPIGCWHLEPDALPPRLSTTSFESLLPLNPDAR